MSIVLNNANGLLLQRDVTFNGTVTLTSGDINTGAHTVTLGSATGANTSGSGDLVGNVKRSGFIAGATYSFGNPNVSLNFASNTLSTWLSPEVPPGLPTDVTLNLVKAQPASFGGYAVNRSYTITPNGGSGYSATVRLHYLDTVTELNGNDETKLELWRYDGATWTGLGKSGSDTTANWVELSGVTAFSDWAISGKTPTAVSLRTLTATPTGAAGVLALLPLLGLLGARGLARRRRTA